MHNLDEVERDLLVDLGGDLLLRDHTEVERELRDA